VFDFDGTAGRMPKVLTVPHSPRSNTRRESQTLAFVPRPLTPEDRGDKTGAPEAGSIVQSGIEPSEALAVACLATMGAMVGGRCRPPSLAGLPIADEIFGTIAIAPPG
jgi:hypothetical protein